MYCTVSRLDTMFDEEKSVFPLETLLNAADDSSSPPENKWLFDKDTLIVYNNKYWKGFFPVDQNFDAVRYFGGFWKRFYKEGDIIKGVTHPYEVPSVYAANLPQLENIHRGLGEVIHLKYTSSEYSFFYDLLRIVDKDIVLEKAFLGISPFSM
jgi:hypothetical protein